jgi:hypothetical protein
VRTSKNLTLSYFLFIFRRLRRAVILKELNQAGVGMEAIYHHITVVVIQVMAVIVAMDPIMEVMVDTADTVAGHQDTTLAIHLQDTTPNLIQHTDAHMAVDGGKRSLLPNHYKETILYIL